MGLVPGAMEREQGLMEAPEKGKPLRQGAGQLRLTRGIDKEWRGARGDGQAS